MGEWADPTFDLYPEALRTEIDEIAWLNYTDVNDGVYKAGFATTQERTKGPSMLCSLASIGSRIDYLADDIWWGRP